MKVLNAIRWGVGLMMVVMSPLAMTKVASAQTIEGKRPVRAAAAKTKDATKSATRGVETEGVRLASAAEVPPAPLKPSETSVTSTREYFTKLQTIVRDLRRSSNNAKTMTAGLKGLLMRQHAARIDKLPVVGVDAEVLDLGEHVSQTLVEAANSVTEGLGRSRVRQTNVPAHFDYYHYYDVYAFGPAYHGYGVYGDGYHYGHGPTVAYGVSTTIQVPNEYNRIRKQQAIGQEERIAAFNTARTAMENVEKDVAAMRHQLSRQYGVEF